MAWPVRPKKAQALSKTCGHTASAFDLKKRDSLSTYPSNASPLGGPTYCRSADQGTTPQYACSQLCTVPEKHLRYVQYQQAGRGGLAHSARHNTSFKAIGGDPGCCPGANCPAYNAILGQNHVGVRSVVQAFVHRFVSVLLPRPLRANPDRIQGILGLRSHLHSTLAQRAHRNIIPRTR